MVVHYFQEHNTLYYYIFLIVYISITFKVGIQSIKYSIWSGVMSCCKWKQFFWGLPRQIKCNQKNLGEMGRRMTMGAIQL